MPEQKHELPYVWKKRIEALEEAPPGGYTQGVRVYHGASQNIANSSWVTLAFNSERYDTDSIHGNVTNNSRLTCRTAGKYLIIGQIGFPANSTGSRAGVILLNGTTYISHVLQDATSDFGNAIICTTIYDLAVNDYVELQALQSSGGTLAVAYSPQMIPEFMMQRIG